jgi:hypothetical protein
MAHCDAVYKGEETISSTYLVWQSKEKPLAQQGETCNNGTATEQGNICRTT